MELLEAIKIISQNGYALVSNVQKRAVYSNREVCEMFNLKFTDPYKCGETVKRYMAREPQCKFKFTPTGITAESVEKEIARINNRKI